MTMWRVMKPLSARYLAPAAMVLATLAAVAACGSSKAAGGFFEAVGDGGDASNGPLDGSVGNPGNPGKPGDPGDPVDSGGPIFMDDAMADSLPKACAAANYKALQAPAALLIVLDKSGTMSANGKYASAQLAIVSAMDQPAFDTMSLGILGFPSGTVTGPACIFNTPVLCDVTALPQVPITLAGLEKSNASTGVRHDMYGWLANNTPSAGTGDGNPSFNALSRAIDNLKAYSLPSGKRMILYITDGGASCTSLSTRPGYTDSNGCTDWEQPESIVSLLSNAHNDTQAPINTFVVGVPGADTPGTDPNTPPYHVRNALSAYAYAGSPETVDPTCTGKTYAQAGGDPVVSCHFDMSQNFTSQKLADAITASRGKVMGCTFDLPDADGGMVDKSKVNVTYSANGASTVNLQKRSSPSDMCTMTGCWDYDANGKVVLVGKACDDVKFAPNPTVHVLLGCATEIK